MCSWGNDKIVRVIRRNNPDVSDGWHLVAVDACLAELVQAMNNAGIITLGCCCGHGKFPPSIIVSIESVALMTEHGYSYGPRPLANYVTHCPALV